MKKSLSLFLSILLLISCLVPAFAANRDQDIPIITIAGTSNTRILNSKGETIIPDNVDPKDILKDKKLMKDLLKAFSVSLITNKWDTYCDKFYDTIAPIWSKQLYNESGEPQFGDTPVRNTARDPKKHSGFNIYDYRFHYDWRLDPFEVARQLDEYIDEVRQKTGHEKVALFGRCYGAVVLATYLSVYGCDKVDNSTFYCSIAKGLETADAVYTGDIAFDADNIDMFVNYYLNYKKPLEDDDLNTLICTFVTLFNACGGLKLSAKTIECVAKKFKDKLLPRILRASYGTYPGYWAMLSSDKTQRAIDYVFAGTGDRYDAIKEKTLRYHEEVQNNLENTLDSCIKKGMKLMVIGKYGEPVYPYFKGSDYQSDGSCSIGKMTFGATYSDIDGVLSDEYIEGVKRNGLGKYISKDKKIDASTCRYRDMTWFFKDSGHIQHPKFIMDLVKLSTKSTVQVTVDDFENYPQFMKKNDDTFSPVTANDESDKKWEKPSFFKTLRVFLKSFFAVLKKLFSGALKLKK